MVSHQHEVPLELIRDDPSLILGFLSSLGVKPPEFSELRLDAAELNELKVTEHHADLVALFYKGRVDTYCRYSPKQPRDNWSP